ncbi:hypothetical protein HYX16_02465 [Candidatus Woesearchaeota archaeon]|nr:hypothetical protein [Candidatus Woesearchaeota archaeon]
MKKRCYFIDGEKYLVINSEAKNKSDETGFFAIIERYGQAKAYFGFDDKAFEIIKKDMEIEETDKYGNSRKSKVLWYLCDIPLEFMQRNFGKFERIVDSLST